MNMTSMFSPHYEFFSDCLVNDCECSQSNLGIAFLFLLAFYLSKYKWCHVPSKGFSRVVSPFRAVSSPMTVQTSYTLGTYVFFHVAKQMGVQHD